MTTQPALTLRPLTYLADGDEVVVGCAEVDAYALLPADGAALLERLGREPADTALRWYEATYGEAVDLAGFVDDVHELGFVADPVEVAPARVPGPLRWQRAGQLLFSPPAWLLFAIIGLTAVLAVLHDPTLAPHPQQVFFSDYLLAIELTIAFGQVPLILVHEVFHVLAARRLGVPATIGVSHRLYFVVFETRMDGLVTLPRGRRFLPMLAGMLADLLLAALLTVAAGTVAAASPTARGVCLALAFSTLLRFALEFVLFLRTDVYYLIGNLTGTVDLHTTSSQILANLGWRLLGRPERRHDPALWHPRDRRMARWYTPVHLVGYAVALALLVTVLAPITWGFVGAAGRQLLHPRLGSGLFWDALGLLVLNTAQPALAGLLALRERARRHRSPARGRTRRTR